MSIEELEKEDAIDDLEEPEDGNVMEDSADAEEDESTESDVLAGTAFEKETIINYNNGESVASFYTLNRFKRAEMLQLAKERPDDVKIIRDDGEGGALEAEFPKKWVKIRAPRILTDEQKEELVKRGKMLASKRIGKLKGGD